MGIELMKGQIRTKILAINPKGLSQLFTFQTFYFPNFLLSIEPFATFTSSAPKLWGVNLNPSQRITPRFLINAG
ncbi:MAG: hypothetical protein EA411_05100 [Saprospirales bacterium]|nr:MAG: hypothetical protein EA411_05100 [Saprospirales bacterium]